MATPVYKLQSVKQESIDLLFTAYELALQYGYSKFTAKCIALVVLDRMRQTGRGGLWMAVNPILKGTATGGSHDPAVFDRLTKGHSLVTPFPMPFQIKGTC